MQTLTLKGKRVVITGASSGIGRACAILASQLGAKVMLVARREDKLRETISLMDGDGDHDIYACDVTDSPALANLVARTGKIDGLVHAAGIGPMCPVGMIDRAHVESVFRINFFSFLELMKHYSKSRNRNEKLSVVAVSSVSAMAGWGGGVAYCGSKGALSASIRSLAIEFAPKGIRVNAVCPSNIRTPLFESGAFDLNDENALKDLLKKQPLGLGDPKQVAWPVCFLLSDAASFITGVNLPVDGGYLAQ